MDLVRNKKRFIEEKKKDLDPGLLKRGLDSLYIETRSVAEKIENGIKKIVQIKDIEELYDIKDETIAILDIQKKPYEAVLDTVSIVKKVNEQLCVIAKDVVLEDYQLYLFNIYNFDGVIFHLEYVDRKFMKEIEFLSAVMGIELIPFIKNETDLSEINRWNEVNVVSPLNEEIIKSKEFPKNVKIIKDINSDIDEKYANAVIEIKENLNE